MSRSSSATGETVSVRVVEEVASAKRVDVAELTPLHDVVDPDALNALTERGFAGTVEFRYAGCRVKVDGTQVRVTAT